MKTSVLSLGLLICIFLGVSTCSTTKYLLDHGAYIAEIKRRSIPLEAARHLSAYKMYEGYFQLVPRVKQFAAEQMGYPRSESYSLFLPDSTHPQWLVSAVKTDSWEPKMWRYPSIGDVGYITFFNRDEARRVVIELQHEGYDTYIRKSWVFIGLDYIYMPVFESTLGQGLSVFVEKLLKGLTHEAYYVRGDSQFNESFGQFMAQEGTKAFLATDETLRKDVLPQYLRILEEMNIYRAHVLRAYSAAIKLLGIPDHPQKRPENWKEIKRTIMGNLSRKLNAERFEYIRPHLDDWNNAQVYAESMYLIWTCHLEHMYKTKGFKNLKQFFNWAKQTFTDKHPSAHMPGFEDATTACYTGIK